MIDDAELKDPLEGDLGENLANEDDLDLEVEAKKKNKDLIDDDTVSADDLAEEEEEEDVEPFDDVNET